VTDDHPVLVLPASPASQSESLRAVGSARSNTSGSGLFSLADHPGRDRLASFVSPFGPLSGLEAS